MKTVRMETLKKALEVLFESAGMTVDVARQYADLYTVTEAKGVYSHGTQLSVISTSLAQKGLINMHPHIKTLHESETTAALDGDQGGGPVVVRHAMELAVEKAARYGSAVVTAFGLTHFGASLYYMDIPVKRNMIAYFYGTSEPIVAPFGAMQAMFGTNPYSFAAPAGQYPAFVVDMATSMGPMNKLFFNIRNNEPAPAGWGLDAEGRPTTDPRAITTDGVMLPFGGVKGSAVNAMTDIMGGVLSGGAYGRQVVSVPKSKEDPANFGIYIHVIDVSRFMDIEEYQRRMDDWLAGFLQLQPAEGFDAVVYPGYRAAKNYEKAQRDGIELLDSNVENMRKAADKAGCKAEIETILNE